MASLQTISAAIESIPSMKENLRNAFKNLQSQSSFLSSFTLQWKDLEDHFDTIEKSIEKRFKDLESAERRLPAAAAEIDSQPSDPVIWPELKSICSRMDSRGLRSFILSHRKDGPNINGELDTALRSASDPAKLVLDTMEGFYPAKSKGDKDSELAALRRACIVLLERLGAISPVVKEPIKERAKKLAMEWKGKIREGGDSLLESMAFFQLLGTFGLVSVFDSDELLDIVVIIARRRQTIELCRTLGLEDKIPDLIQKLTSKGKQLDAVNFAYAFGLVDKFPPVPLLKAYLKEAKRVSLEVRNKGNHSSQSMNESTAKEISALKAVIKSVEDHNLRSEYPCKDLEKRIAQLEKQKADRKRKVRPQQQQRQPTNKRSRPTSMAPDTGPPLLSQPPQPAGLIGDRLNPYPGSSGLYGLAGGAHAGSSSSGLYGLAGGAGTEPVLSSLHALSGGLSGPYGLAGGPGATLYDRHQGGAGTAPVSSSLHALSGGPVGSSGPYGLAGGHSATLYDRHQGSSLTGTHVAYGGSRTPPRSHLLQAEAYSSSLYDKPVGHGGYPGVPPQYPSSYYP